MNKHKRQIAAKLNLAQAEIAAQRFVALNAEQLGKVEGGLTGVATDSVSTPSRTIARW